jgi:hypothetical protein
VELCYSVFVFFKYSTNVDEHVVYISTSKILSRLDLNIYEVDHQDLTVDGPPSFIISCKYNIYIKSRIEN